MSSALVPGRILLAAPLSKLLNSFCCSSVARRGDLGPSWSSGAGGGLGRRGELEGDATAAIAGGLDCMSELCPEIKWREVGVTASSDVHARGR
jgi:hypothetical protein